MNKNIVIISLFFVLLISNIAWYSILRSNLSDADSNSNLEINVRDNVIKDMSELIHYQNKNISKAELIDILDKGFNSEFVMDEGQWVDFRSIKFEFKDGKLIRVYW